MFNYATKYMFAWLGITIALTVYVTAYKQADGSRRPCYFAAKCSNEGELVWSTDGKNCRPYPNACQLANDNCQRRNRFEKEFSTVSKEECQKLCQAFCTLEYKPVCAEYKGSNRTFPNPCGLSSHICATGETYNFIREGKC